MQIDRKAYDPAQHDKYKALCIKQPFADLMTRAEYRDEEGAYHAAKAVEIRRAETGFRGDVLICAAARPQSPVLQTCCTCGLAELYDVKPVAELTEDEWRDACVKDRPATGYAWLFRNPRRVVEMPVKGQPGFYDLVVPKGDITEYPRNVMIGGEQFEKMRRAFR